MSRQQAADFLGVSTRTIDRYVKKGTLHYKKVANKVLIAQEELDQVKKDLDLLNQPTVSGSRESSSSSSATTQPNNEGSIASIKDGDFIGAISEFGAILTQKDQTIEEKNQLIYMLQRKIGEIETQMANMVALPHHTEAKEELEEHIASLEQQTETLAAQVRKEKMLNVIYLGLIIIAVVVVGLWLFS